MSKVKEYRITKEHCQKMLDDRNNPVCSGCGKKVVPIETFDNGGNPTFWSGCNDCGRFDNGVTHKIFQIAEHMVVHNHHRPYMHLEEPLNKDTERYSVWKSNQISGATRTVTLVLALNEKITKQKPD